MRYISFLLISVTMVSSVFAQGTVIDHTCADLDQIPSLWITAVQNTLQSHYAHTSHGGQLSCGVEFIEDGNSFYDCELGYLTLPVVSGAYCVFEGQESEGYVSPDLYWETPEGLGMTRSVLDNNPALDTSMWCWCCQCDYYDQSAVQAYLDAMNMLENEYPDVIFVYFTGNAQGTGSEGYNRYLRNNQIRDYCAVNNKVLFDFADLDCWWYNNASSEWEQHIYSYSGTDIPSEHPQYYGDEYAHTTAESCTVKGNAWWWMMAVLAGWSNTGISSSGSDTAGGISLIVENPVYVPFEVTAFSAGSDLMEINVYDVSGRRTGICGQQGDQVYMVSNLAAGVYYINASDGREAVTCKTVVLN